MRNHPKRRHGAMPAESPPPYVNRRARLQQGDLELQLLLAIDTGSAAGILAACEAALQAVASVTASLLHPYPHIPGHSQAILDLKPHRQPPQALEALLSMGGGAWRQFGTGASYRAVWQSDGETCFLHPAVRWACVSRTTLPRSTPQR